VVTATGAVVLVALVLVVASLGVVEVGVVARVIISREARGAGRGMLRHKERRPVEDEAAAAVFRATVFANERSKRTDLFIESDFQKEEKR
jgi:hypothetical protein